MLKDFTLIIPTRNRHPYISRGMSYYGNSGVKVFIVDSSEKKFERDIPFDNINYFHLPGFTFVQKIIEILKLIKTPYAGLCADDDFILPLSLATCVDFLNDNPPYASAQGNYLVYIRTGLNKLVFSPVLHPYNWEINSEKPSERLHSLFEKYFHLFYAVHRTESLKEIFLSYGNGPNNLNLVEMHIAFMGVINGRHRSLPILYNVREIIFSSIGYTAGNVIQLFHNHPEWRTQFIHNIAARLSEKENISYEAAALYCEKMIRLYSARIENPGTVQKIINSVVPEAQRYRIKYMRLRMQYGSIDNYNKHITRNRHGYPFSGESYTAEMNKIKSIVLEHKV